MGQRTETISISADTTLTRAQANSDSLVVCDTSGGAVVPTLPADAEDGARVTFKRDGGNAVTITPPVGQTIDGAADKAIETDLFAYTLQLDLANANWVIVASHDIGAS